MDFRPVINFKFKNNQYLLLINNKNKRFFLKNNHNNYEYPTIEELIELNNLFTNFPLVMRIEKGKKYNFIPKVFINGTLAILSLTTFLTACKSKPYSNYYDKPTTQIEESTNQNLDNSNENNLNDTNSLAFLVEDGDEPLEEETYYESDWLKFTYIYDHDYLDKMLNYSTVSPDEIKTTVDSNPLIKPKFNTFTKEYIDMVATKYPHADLRILNENLKTLEFVECTKQELMLESLSADSYACYVKPENKIYVLKDYEYEKGTWEYQVLMHELSHALRNCWQTKNDIEYKTQFMGLNVDSLIIDEAMNSVFTVSLFDYEEKDIAYQLQSNYLSVILESLDNYSLEDYVNHSMSYFAIKLDEATGYTNYATVIFEIIEAQYKDYHTSYMDIEESEFYPLYDYIADLYFNKYITADMTYEEAKNICDTLIAKITFDVPSEYHIDTNHFYDYFEEYVIEKGITGTLNR